MADKQPDLSLTPIEVAWLAGLLEGEGTFALDARAKDRYDDSTAPPGCYMKVSMTDKDVIDKVANLFQRKSFSPNRKTKGEKKEHIVNIADRKTLIYIFPLLYPHLGERRQKEVDKCLDVLKDWQEWYEKGGRSLAARKGALTRAANARKKLLETKSDVEDVDA